MKWNARKCCESQEQRGLGNLSGSLIHFPPPSLLPLSWVRLLSQISLCALKQNAD